MNVGTVVAVDGSLIPTIPLKLHHSDGADLEIEALMDSGFSGEVALPMGVVNELGLEYARGQIVALADGSHHRVETYRGSVFFADEWHDVVVYSTGGSAAIGMRLLYGSKIGFEAAPEGEIDCEQLDHPRLRWPSYRR